MDIDDVAVLVRDGPGKTANKQELREQVWNELEESGEARFPFPP